MSIEDAGAPTLIVDLPLAVDDTMSPLFVVRLAAEAQVWLLPALWRQLDRAAVALIERGRSHGGTTLETRSTETDAVIALWERARLSLTGRAIYWPAETAEEASLPRGFDASFINRFDGLAAALAATSPRRAREWIEAGELDALVLAAALCERPAAILTLCDDVPAAEPLLVRRAAALGARTQPMSAALRARLQRAWLAPLLMRAGLLEAVGAGVLRLSYVRLAAPTVLLADLPPDEDAFVDRPPPWLAESHLFWANVA